MELENSLSYSQDLATGSYGEPNESSTHLHTVSLGSSLILSYHLRPDLPSGLFFQVFRLKFCTQFSSPCALHAHPSSPLFDRHNNIWQMLNEYK